MNNSLCSIIMPCHNGERYLADSIQSVINQTYKNWELLIVDDNSQDNSINIIKSFVNKDSRIALYENRQSTGSPATPRNIGLSNANGKYIAFLDCDDIWLPSKLEKQILMMETENIYVAFSYYEKIDENGSRQERIITAPASTTYKELLKTDVIGNLTGIYNKEKCGLVFQKVEPQEDYIMWLEILKEGYIAKCYKEVLALYRVSSGSLSHSKLKNFKWQWNTYRKVFHLNFFYSIFLYIHYAINGFIKFVK